MSIESKLHKSTCPFCLYGCGLSVNQTSRGSFTLRKVEYDREASVNQGRLCARGNAATHVLDDKRRLTSPLLNNKKIDWVTAISQIKSQLKSFSPKEIAITYDLNNTTEELAAISGFAHELKIDSVARAYLEPEAFFSYGLPEVKHAALSDINEAKVILIVGDVFGKTPVISKPILDAKYADRNNRLFYIDSVKTKIAGFANKFLWAKPGTEPLLLLALIVKAGKAAKIVIGDNNFNKLRRLLPQLSELSGVADQSLEEVIQGLLSIPKGVILASMDFGKTDDPLLLSSLVQLLTVVLPGDKKFCSPALASVPLGKIGFGDIIDNIQQGKTKALINFGNLFPFYYPALIPTLSNLKLFITTSIYLNNLPFDNMILPVPSLLEKYGTINTLWDRVILKPLAEPVSGTKPISEIIKQLAGDLNKSKPTFTSNIAIDEIINRGVNFAKHYKKSDEISVLGEESAFGYRGIYANDSDILKVNPLTASKYEIKQDNSVKLLVDGKEKSFTAKITTSVTVDTITISVDKPDNRELFPIRIDNLTKEIIIAPAKGKLIKVS